MDISGRLNQVINTHNLTIKDFARECEIPYRSMYNYVRGEREPNLDALSKISQTFNVDLNWLIVGDIYIDKISYNLDLLEIELLDCYRKSNKSAQKIMITVAKSLLVELEH